MAIGVPGLGEVVCMMEPTRTAETRHRFTVRMLGRPFSAVFGMVGSSIDDLPGDDGRPHGEVAVHAWDSESLADVLDRAAVRFGLYNLHSGRVSEAVVWIRFQESPDDRFEYDERLRWAQSLSVLDRSGRVRLARRLDQVSVADLLRTAEAGLIDGDPLQPYLIPTIPQGGLEPWGLDWPQLIGYLQMFWVGVGALATVDGAVSLAARLRARLQRTPRVLAERQAQSGGTPELLWDIFHHRPVLPEQAAEWLNCTIEDAEALLLALGLDDRGDGLWEPDASEDARVMSKVLLEIRTEMGLLGSQRGTLDTRLQHLVETGERLAIPDIYEWEHRPDALADHGEPSDDEGLDDEDIIAESRRYELPLDRLRLECSCDDATCDATARITFAGKDRLRFEVNPPGHFEAPSGFLERLAIEQAESDEP